VIAILKRPLRRLRPNLTVAPPTPTFPPTQLVGRQKPPLRRVRPQVIVARVTPTVAATYLLQGVKRLLKARRVPPQVSVSVVPPGVPATVVRARFPRRALGKLRSLIRVNPAQPFGPVIGTAPSPVGTPTQPTIGQASSSPVGMPTQPAQGQQTPSPVGQPTQKQP
jgi:hypothetical protein